MMPFLFGDQTTYVQEILLLVLGRMVIIERVSCFLNDD